MAASTGTVRNISDDELKAFDESFEPCGYSSYEPIYASLMELKLQKELKKQVHWDPSKDEAFFYPSDAPHTETKLKAEIETSAAEDPSSIQSTTKTIIMAELPVEDSTVWGHVVSSPSDRTSQPDTLRSNDKLICCCICGTIDRDKQGPFVQTPWGRWVCIQYDCHIKHDEELMTRSFVPGSYLPGQPRKTHVPFDAGIHLCREHRPKKGSRDDLKSWFYNAVRADCKPCVRFCIQGHGLDKRVALNSTKYSAREFAVYDGLDDLVTFLDAL